MYICRTTMHELTRFVSENGNRVTMDEAIEHFEELRPGDGELFVTYWLDEIPELVTDRFGGKTRIEKVNI